MIAITEVNPPLLIDTYLPLLLKELRLSHLEIGKILGQPCLQILIDELKTEQLNSFVVQPVRDSK